MTVFAKIWARQTAPRAAHWPCKDFSGPVKRIIADAIRLAWQRVCEHIAAEGGAPLELSEPELTTLLQEELRTLRARPVSDAQGFTASKFEDVPRDASQVSFDGKHLEKQPDLAIRLTERYPGDPSGRALFIECKLVRAKRPVSDYGREGISRFVAGEYGWTMPSGMMVAYADSGYTVPDKLVPHLRKAQADKSDPYQTRALPEEDELFTGTEPRVYVSRHHRAWRYIQTESRPGAVTLYHLWLPLR